MDSSQHPIYPYRVAIAPVSGGNYTEHGDIRAEARGRTIRHAVTMTYNNIGIVDLTRALSCAGCMAPTIDRPNPNAAEARVCQTSWLPLWSFHRSLAAWQSAACDDQARRASIPRRSWQRLSPQGLPADPRSVLHATL